MLHSMQRTSYASMLLNDAIKYKKVAGLDCSVLQQSAILIVKNFLFLSCLGLSRCGYCCYAFVCANDFCFNSDASFSLGSFCCYRYRSRYRYRYHYRCSCRCRDRFQPKTSCVLLLLQFFVPSTLSSIVIFSLKPMVGSCHSVPALF